MRFPLCLRRLDRMRWGSIWRRIRCSNSNMVTVIDENKKTVTNINVGTNPSAVAVNWVTNRIYVDNSGSNNVSVIDGSNDSVTNVAVGLYPTALAVDTNRNRVYVANTQGNDLTERANERDCEHHRGLLSSTGGSEWEDEQDLRGVPDSREYRGG
jgi:YVTN family beta-propeller protein